MSVGITYPNNLLPIKGIRLSATSANLYSEKRDDLALIELPKRSVVSAVFTKNNFCAAPVKIAKEKLNDGTARYLLINAGNANAGTGEQGIVNANMTCQALSELTSCPENEILPFSTGVIGEDLPTKKITQALPELVNNLTEDNWLMTAEAIMTTDTIAKAISIQIEIDGVTVCITGIAKGSGMIKPNMATMLAFIATDVNISKEAQDKLLSNSVNKSFNRITVDGDTSTNDACVIFSTGEAGNTILNDDDDLNFKKFEEALNKVCRHLAQSIIRDGEGAKKFISIIVNGGKDENECLDVAYKIAESPLVKTAFTASDPNWGRILAAVGNSNVPNLDIDDVTLFLDDVCIVENSGRAVSYTEAQGKKVMSQDEIVLTVNLRRGTHNEEIWTTDLSHDYITINAEYRT